MKNSNQFAQIIENLKAQCKKPTVAVVCPYDDHTVEAIALALNEAIARFILVGERSRIEAVAPDMCMSSDVDFYEVDDSDAAAASAVNLVREHRADVLMKGLINTDNFLKAILNKTSGILPQGNILYHLSVAEIPSYHKLLFFSDAAVIPYPTIQQRIAMIDGDIAVCKKFGVATPKVALINFTEKINPKFPVSTDYAEILALAANGRFSHARIDGPMDVKTACDKHSAEVKGQMSDVTGDADVLIFPNIEAANTFYKSIALFSGAIIGGNLMGAQSPVVLSSRSDSIRSKFYSLAMACVNAG